MRTRRFLLAIAAVGVVVSACTGDDDDDDDGFGGGVVITGGTTVAVGATLQLSATSGAADVTSLATWTSSSASVATISSSGLVTGITGGSTLITATYEGESDTLPISVTGGSLTQDIVYRGGFRNNNELWMCIEHQFAGSINNIHFEDPDSAACVGLKQGVGIASSAEAPRYSVVIFEPVSCDSTQKHWTVDYAVDDDRCQGCVNQELVFDADAALPYGTFCGPGGGTIPIIEEIRAHVSSTTGKLRFYVDVGTSSDVAIKEMRLNTNADDFVSKCTSGAVITQGGDGLFDAECAPTVGTSGTFTPGNTYRVLLQGELDGKFFQGYYDWDFELAP